MLKARIHPLTLSSRVRQQLKPRIRPLDRELCERQRTLAKAIVCVAAGTGGT